MEHIKDIFRPYGTEFYYVELVASQKVRLERNATENRLRHKASKRNVELSNQRLLQDDAKFRLESLPGEITFENYLRLDNTHLSPQQAAEKIREAWGL